MRGPNVHEYYTSRFESFEKVKSAIRVVTERKNKREKV